MQQKTISSETYAQNLARARALLAELSQRCHVFGPFWLYVPEGVSEPTVKFELQPFVEGLNLAYVQALIKGQGYGRQAMKHLCELADKHQCPILLHVDPSHGTPFKVLVEFYKSFGFVKRPKQGRQSMWRLPIEKDYISRQKEAERERRGI